MREANRYRIVIRRHDAAQTADMVQLQATIIDMIKLPGKCAQSVWTLHRSFLQLPVGGGSAKHFYAFCTPSVEITGQYYRSLVEFDFLAQLIELPDVFGQRDKVDSVYIEHQ